MQRMARSLVVPILAMVVVLSGCVPHQPPTRQQDACEALRSLTWPGAQVTAAEHVAPGALAVAAADVADGTQPAVNAALAKLPSFCRVKVAAKPGPGSDIRIEVWLPAAGWNGRLQAVGDGGLAGYIPFGLMAPALQGGYATAGTAGRIGVDLMVNRTPAHQIPASKYAMVHRAVLQACDALDGTGATNDAAQFACTASSPTDR